MISLVDKYSQSMSHDSCRRIGLVTTKAQRAFHTRPRKEGVASLGECCRLAKSLFVARTMPPSHVEEGRRGSKRPPSPRNVSRCECHPRTQRPGPKDPGGGFHRRPLSHPPRAPSGEKGKGGRREKGDKAHPNRDPIPDPQSSPPPDLSGRDLLEGRGGRERWNRPGKGDGPRYLRWTGKARAFMDSGDRLPILLCVLMTPIWEDRTRFIWPCKGLGFCLAFDAGFYWPWASRPVWLS
jgi:hypothetical protein